MPTGRGRGAKEADDAIGRGLGAKEADDAIGRGRGAKEADDAIDELCFGLPIKTLAGS